jgi:hypothetical protein
MALLGSYIDTRTIAGIAAGGSSSYAHGLPAAPDIVVVGENTTAATNVSAIKLVTAADATNVSVYNHGEGASQALKCIAIMAHSIIR